MKLMSKPANKMYLFWEHFIKSVLAFSGTFAALFFGPLFFDAKSSSRREFKLRTFDKVVLFMTEHQFETFLFCLFIALIVNIYVFRKNSKVRYVNEIFLNKEKVGFTVIDLKFNKSNQVICPLVDLHLELIASKVDDEIEKRILRFVNKKEKKLIGEILPSHFLWEKKKPELKEIINQLAKSNVDLKRIKNEKNSMTSSMFVQR